jgi:hypothetical protein
MHFKIPFGFRPKNLFYLLGAFLIAGTFLVQLHLSYASGRVDLDVTIQSAAAEASPALPERPRVPPRRSPTRHAPSD